jgi:hypothetical protein
LKEKKDARHNNESSSRRSKGGGEGGGEGRGDRFTKANIKELAFLFKPFFA